MFTFSKFSLLLCHIWIWMTFICSHCLCFMFILNLAGNAIYLSEIQLLYENIFLCVYFWRFSIFAERMKLCRWWGSAVRQCHKSSCTRNNINNSSNSNISSSSNINSNSQQRIVLKSASTDVFTNLGKALRSLNIFVYCWFCRRYWIE